MTKDQKVIRAKVGLLELAKQLGNVSQACKMMGYSRDSFYRFKELYEKGGEIALTEISRQNRLKNRVAKEIESAMVGAGGMEQPLRADAHRQWIEKARADRVASQRVLIRGATPRCWKIMKKRSEALEAGRRQGWRHPHRGPACGLGESQMQKEAHGEFESEHPGYCGARDLLCGQYEGRRTKKSANLRGHLLGNRPRQAL